MAVPAAAPAVLSAPLAPVKPWWAPAPRRSMMEEAVQRVLGHLTEAKVKEHAYAACRLSCEGAGRINMVGFYLDSLKVQGITIDQRPRVSDARTAQSQTFTCLTTHSMDHTREAILKHVVGRGVPPLTFEVVSGPHPFTPVDIPQVAETDPQLKPGFKVALPVNLEFVARSEDAEELLRLVDLTYGDVCATNKESVAALHLAALSGDARVAAAVASIVETACAGQRRPWQLEDGRTPLHLAVLFNSAELVQALLPVCDPSVLDQWGYTALQTAQDLNHGAAAAALQGGPADLKSLCRASLCALLAKGASPAAVESLRPMLQGHEAQAVVPLGEYRALSTVAATALEMVDCATLLRSMSCMECWFGDLFNRKCSAALPAAMELIKVWEDLPSFQAAPPPGGMCEPDTAVLVEASSSSEAPTVADREVFCERFHRRTGGVLRDMDWSNVMAIGGMVLACLVADDAEFADKFQGTDVDLYVTGTGFDSNKPFEERVCEVVESLPGSVLSMDKEVYISGQILTKHAGQLGLEFSEDKENERLVITGIKGAFAEWRDQREFRAGAVGDFIVEVGDRTGINEMKKRLTNIKPKPKGRGKGKQELSWPSVNLKIRPQHVEKQEVSSAVIRTPSTLTMCLRKRTGEALPNVQVVLSPYAGPAHLLFNTDIDCTALGFDGTDLYATPRAREAIRHRRIVARPEKYSVRGEWHTDARLLKYARRGFSVVDLGVRPGAQPPQNEQIASAAQDFLRLQEQHGQAAAEAEARAKEQEGSRATTEQPEEGAAGEADEDEDDDEDSSESEGEGARRATLRMQMRSEANDIVKKVRKTGVDGACLLFLAGAHEGLRQLLLAEYPLLVPGMTHDDLVGLVEVAGGKRTFRREEQEAALMAKKESMVWYNDGYTTAAANLVIVNPANRGEYDIRDGRLRGLEMPLEKAAEPVDVEADRFCVGGWYDGLYQKDLRDDYVELDPAIWRGQKRARR